MTIYDKAKPKVIFLDGTLGSVSEKRRGSIPGTSTIRVAIPGKKSLLSSREERTIPDIPDIKVDHLSPNDHNYIPNSGLIWVWDTIDGSDTSNIMTQYVKRLQNQVVHIMRMLEMRLLEVLDLRNKLEVTADSDLMFKKLTQISESMRKIRTNLWSFSPEQGGFGGGMGGFGGGTGVLPTEYGGAGPTF